MRLMHHFKQTLVGVMPIIPFASYGTSDAVPANNRQRIRDVVHKNDKRAGHASGLRMPERPLHFTPSPSAEPAVATRTQGIGVCSPEVVGDLVQPRGPLY